LAGNYFAAMANWAPMSATSGERVERGRENATSGNQTDPMRGRGSAPAATWSQILIIARNASAWPSDQLLWSPWALAISSTFIHPRWHTPPEPTKRIVGAFVLILSFVMVFSPIPLSNVPPALTIAVIALAYLEGDGVLLSVALLGAVILLAIALVAVWEAVRGAEWVSRVL
jgi:Exopolysaccharide synthesis, ExoD